MSYPLPISSKEIQQKHEICVVQPYLSGNYQVDLLLRNHNWAGNINTAVKLSYKTYTEYSPSIEYQNDFWNSDGKKIKQFLEYLFHKCHNNAIYNEISVDYIEDDDNRDAYHLYENNFVSSFDQTEYILNIKFENIRNSIINNPDNEISKQFFWLTEINSIYEINNKMIDISDTELQDDVKEFFERSYIEPNLTKEFTDNKFNLMVKYVFANMEEISNIKFEEAINNEKISLYSKPINSHHLTPKDEYFSLEYFDYDNGKTNHVSLIGDFQVTNSTIFSQVDFSGTLHGIGHLIIDHPNDANIAIRENILPSDDDWSQRYEDYGISNEYRADNGCMSVMAFTECFYQGNKFFDRLTYMPIDIQAIQHQYGKNKYTRAEDTTYILTPNQTYINNFQNPMFPIDLSKQYHEEIGQDKNGASIQNTVKHNVIYSIYDAGGINTFDLSFTESAKIDLNQGAGHFNVIGDNFFLIAYDVDIHNVIVKTGDIEIKLNNLANNITVPSNGAKLTIENFSNEDHIILDDITNLDMSFIGCIKPYSNSGDNDTEICFI